MGKFENIKNEELLCEYLRESYSRLEAGSDGMNLSHYTTISRLLNILKTGYLWLGDYRNMNDPFEKKLLDRNNYARNLYFTSFSRAEESLAMYKIYNGDNPESSVVLQISFDVFEKIMSYACHGEYAGGVDDDGEFPQYNRKLHIVKMNSAEVIKRTIYSSVYAAEIAYLDPKTGCVYFDGRKNSHFISPLRCKKLAGLIKYKCWDFEQEVRLCAMVSEPLDNGEVVAIKLPRNFCKKIKVVLGPGFDETKYKEELFELRLLGVVFQNSVYEGYYTNFARGRDLSDSFVQKLHLNDYINKLFSGVDPWGEKLSVIIKGQKGNTIFLKWINSVSIEDGIIDVILDKDYRIENNFTLSFDIQEKINISDDPNEHLAYNYCGTILFAGNVVSIAFNEGNCSRYVFGGSGNENYYYTGGWRNAMNSLTVLHEE